MVEVLGKQRHTAAPHTITKEAALLAQIRRNPLSRTTHDLHEADMGMVESGRVIHEESEKIVMFKPIVRPTGETVGYTRRITAVHMMENCIADGWLAYCPGCGTDCGPNPNDCTAREKVAFARCPECGKDIYDPGQGDSALTAEAEPGEIRFDLDESTPRSRIRHKLLLHYAAYHPDEMVRRGLAPVRPPTLEVVPRAVVPGDVGGIRTEKGESNS